MKIHRSWEIKSDDERKIQIRKQYDGGVLHPLVEVLSLKLNEGRDSNLISFDGTLRVKDGNGNLLDKIAKNFMIDLEGEAVPFKEVKSCCKLGVNGTELTFVSSMDDPIRDGADIKIESRTWEIASEDPREILLKGIETKMQQGVSSLTIIEKNKGEKYTVIMEPGSDLSRAGNRFDIVLKSIKGNTCVFEELVDCHNFPGQSDYQVIKENVKWA